MAARCVADCSLASWRCQCRSSALCADGRCGDCGASAVRFLAQVRLLVDADTTRRVARRSGGGGVAQPQRPFASVVSMASDTVDGRLGRTGRPTAGRIRAGV